MWQRMEEQGVSLCHHDVVVLAPKGCQTVPLDMMAVRGKSM
jgi:hypothetical protein